MYNSHIHTHKRVTHTVDMYLSRHWMPVYHSVRIVHVWRGMDFPFAEVRTAIYEDSVCVGVCAIFCANFCGF